MCDGLRLRARAALVLALVASSQGDSAVGGAPSRPSVAEA